MTRPMCWAMRAAAAGALALLASSSIAGAQEPPPASETPAAENSPAPTVPKTDAAPQADTTANGAAGAEKGADTKPPSPCKGLVEHACRTDKACTWIIPKEADKTGQVRSPYCHKLGTTAKKAKKPAAGKAAGLASPAAPPQQAPPASAGAPPNF